MPDAKLKPHYLGHWESRRKDLAATAREGMPDCKMLELLLYQTIPSSDAKPTIKDLLASLRALLSTPPEDLQRVKGIGEAAAISLKVSHAAGLLIARSKS